jgi:DNA-binding CsgD family transcriptional regulator
MTRDKAEFTKQEECIAALLGQGKSSGEIANVLDISYGTLRIHLSNMRKKLGVSTTSGMMTRLMNQQTIASNEKAMVELRKKLEAILPFSMINNFGADEQEAMRVTEDVIGAVFGKEKGDAA